MGAASRRILSFDRDDEKTRKEVTVPASLAMRRPAGREKTSPPACNIDHTTIIWARIQCQSQVPSGLSDVMAFSNIFAMMKACEVLNLRLCPEPQPYFMR